MSGLKPRDIWEVANQLEGYVGPDTEERLAEFLMREGKEAAKLAERIVELEKELNTRAAPDVPELVTLATVDQSGHMLDVTWVDCVKALKYTHGLQLIAKDQAAAMLAAKDAEIERLRKKLRQEFQLGLTTLERAEAAEAKLAGHKAARQSYADLFDGDVGSIHENIRNLKAELAQIKAQEPVIIAEVTRLGTDYRYHSSLKIGTHPLYTSPAPAEDLKAKNERLRDALSKSLLTMNRYKNMGYGDEVYMADLCESVSFASSALNGDTNA